MNGLEDSADALASFFKAVHSASPVGGYTHNFYRYPARFSPQFARAAIEAFSRPGDTIFDPFMGGGTAAVEALAAGRKFIGSDINSLSVFVTKVKTTPLSRSDIDSIAEWASVLPSLVNLHSKCRPHENWTYYQRNLPWWLRKTLEMSLDTLVFLPKPRQRRFARCTLLKTAQWALDCRQHLPRASEFLETHSRDVANMLEAATSFTGKLREKRPHESGSYSGCRRLLYRSAAGIEDDRRVPCEWIPPRLVLTSPPYVGIHVLYHRWQIQGRRETPTPYWLADCQDGHGEIHYTFADRRRKEISHYMAQLRACFRSITALLDQRSLVVQLVAFSDPEQQLGPYLETLRSVGLIETDVCGFDGSFERVWRIVPNRKWYARVKGDLPTRKEVLLVHRKDASTCR